MVPASARTAAAGNPPAPCQPCLEHPFGARQLSQPNLSHPRILPVAGNSKLKLISVIGAAPSPQFQQATATEMGMVRSMEDSGDAFQGNRAAMRKKLAGTALRRTWMVNWVSSS